MGGLAGFAVTGIVLLAGLARDRTDVETAAFNTVLTMFIVAYFYYVGNAFLISYLPHRDTSGDLVPRVHFSLASTMEYRTLFVSWFALVPLLQTYGLSEPVNVLFALLPLSLALGSVIIAMAADGLGVISVTETYTCAAIGTGLGLAYAGVVTAWLPDAASESSALYVTIAIFCINGLGFVLAGLTPLSPRYPAVERFYTRHGRRIVLVDMQLTMVSLAFLWMAVVGAV
jgi:hypothetical protein